MEYPEFQTGIFGRMESAQKCYMYLQQNKKFDWLFIVDPI